MSPLPNIVLPKPDEFGSQDDWARAITRELESILSRQGGSVRPPAVPKARLPSAKKPGVIMTILDDAEVGVCQVYSDGTQWLRVQDDYAVDAAVMDPIDRLRVGATYVDHIGDPSYVAFFGTGSLTITPNVPIAGWIQFDVPVVDVSPERTYGTDQSGTNPTASWQYLWQGVAINGAATGGKKFELSFGTTFQYFHSSTLPQGTLEFRFHVGPLGTSADPIVLHRRQYFFHVILATSTPAYDEMSVADFEIQTTSASDKLSVTFMYTDHSGAATQTIGLAGTTGSTPAWPAGDDAYSWYEIVEVM